jgi:CRP/FNR family transcriptional regulator
MFNGARMASTRQTEDVLGYLPHKPVIEYRRGQIIYDENRPSNGLYLVIRGRAKVQLSLENGCQTVVDIYGANQFFGESGLLHRAHRCESAVSLDNVALVSWTANEIEDQITREPKLGMALIQMLTTECLEFEERLRSFALDKTSERIMRALLRFAERQGTRAEDGSIRIPPLTHQLISEYVGTSREIVTFQMNHLRQEGFIRYSRRGIDVYADSLREHLRRQSGENDIWQAFFSQRQQQRAFDSVS